jgi:hypothetical protein
MYLYISVYIYTPHECTGKGTLQARFVLTYVCIGFLLLAHIMFQAISSQITTRNAHSLLMNTFHQTLGAECLLCTSMIAFFKNKTINFIPIVVQWELGLDALSDGVWDSEWGGAVPSSLV